MTKDNRVSVDDFVSVEDDAIPGIARVLVWTETGVSFQITRDVKATCVITAQLVKDALRTWDGWK